ncbi:MAG TPA: M20/M25/M40 family metallo-hydrolase, partial [Candidatus Acidoferrum sp.]|nr:M20/M25/M40 family metallo-hydrolase [Candidatus Acidoferrum sp.]
MKLSVIRNTMFTVATITLALAAGVAVAARASLDNETRELARRIFKQLVEINTTESVGSTTKAAEMLAGWLRGAGFADSDVQLVGPDSRHGNLVVRIHGTGVRPPVLFICHLDVVEARREDWSTDPFQFIEKDGYFYGRGTEDIKDGDAILVTDFIRLEKEGYRPDRDLILALTADEEAGSNNGVVWLLANRRELIDADFVVNPDAGNFEMENGKKSLVGVGASEKLYQDFELKVTNRGGHGSLPTPDNAIYQLAEGLTRLEHYQFPFELNDVTRAYFTRMADLFGGDTGADMKAILKVPADSAAIDRLAKTPYYNARMRTTCTATMLNGGHANNALPQTATANINCRILPGHSSDEIRATLVKIVNDPEIAVTAVVANGAGSTANPPATLRPDVMGAVEKVTAEMWPGVPVVPVMDSGASDNSTTRGAGYASYGLAGVFIDINDDRSHGRDERLPVASFYEGVDFYYRLMKAFSSK